MTREEIHADQMRRVQASLVADDMRETHRGVYPVRGRETGRDAVETPRFEPMRPMRNVVRRSGRWS